MHSQKKRPNALCSEITIKVLLLRRRVDLLFLLRRLSRQYVYRVLVRSIDILLRRRHRHFHRVIAFARLDHAEVRADFIIAFRSPRHVAAEKY
jgi:hypothetical protein